MNTLITLIHRYTALAKFLIVGVSASLVHGIISWIFYYHILLGHTLISTLTGYSGGWLVSYLGNRIWSFRVKEEVPIVASAAKFIVSQLVAACVLLFSTWTIQQIIILYFKWYIITNNLHMTEELRNFCSGASYPPALFGGMFVAAIASYLMMKCYVFKKH
ncbi:MAG: GtrA family protein [Akkermansia sp.]|nr:GtrA family protein [Akkermansia sp.]